MNIKKLSLFIFCLSFVVNQSLFSAARNAVSAGIWTLRDQAINPETLVSLEEYNKHNFGRQINYNKIKNFLDDELKKNHLDPDNFSYFVASLDDDWQIGTVDKDWQIVKATHGYHLIVPDFTPTTLGLVKSLWSGKIEQTASNTFNIQDLNKTLETVDNTRIPLYRLAIAKAIVAAENKGTFHGLSSAIAQAAFAYLGEGTKTIEPNLQYAFTALANIYPMITGNKQWIAYQKALDEYILNSLDIELIKAHIKDLEQQSTEQKGSITTTLWNYIPYSTKSRSALEERIETINNFLTDNDLELRLAQSIRNKQANKLH